MNRVDLRIRLLDPVVLSERSATGGGHRTLRHVPGSVLLGAAAAKLYRSLAPEDAFLLFHSGRVRFLPGMPSPDGRSAAWPVPLSFMHPKSGLKTAIHNGCFPLPTCADQHVPFRGGFLNAAGKIDHPQTCMVTKTAIDAISGSAAKSQLFSYECLAPGQTFLAAVEADPDVPKAFFDAAVDVLVGQVRLGRSRSAEFGRVRIDRLDTTSPAPTAVIGDEGFAVWALSDLAILDACGQPTAEPSAQDLGLPGRVQWARSFVRVRRYAPWNAHRGGFDAERLVLQAGSVLWIEGADRSVVGGFRSIGRHTESGLGRVWIGAALLVAATPVFGSAPVAKSDTAAAAAPQTPLLSWFLQRGGRANVASDLDRRVAKLEEEVVELYNLVKTEVAPSPGVPFGPSSTQWRDVARLAEAGFDDEDLLPRLFDATKGVARADRPGWRDPFWDAASTQRVLFSQRFQTIMKSEHSAHRGLAAVLALLARRLSKHAVVGVRTENRHSSDSILMEVRR